MKLDCSTDSSSETESSSENAYSSFKENSDDVTIYHWRIDEVDVKFIDEDEMFKDDIKTLKWHIYVKRRQLNAYHETKPLFENNLMLHIDFAKNDQQDAIQKCMLPKLPTTIESHL